MLLVKLIVVLAGFTATAGFSPRPSFTSSHAQWYRMGSVPTDQLGQTTTSHDFSNISPENGDSSNIEEDKLSFPWTDFQEWALRDNILKYVVSVPRKGADRPELYALWRTMSREVVELSGYPVEMLREKYSKQLISKAGEPEQMSSNPGILPLLDDYEFEIAGGLSGRVYGIPGVADGSKIETASVSEVQLTLPKGYVLTDDASVVYELGTPMRSSYGLENSNLPASSMAMANSAMQSAGEFTQEALATSREAVPGDALLVRLGGTTAILLAGATAINLLSHHMTVNVFWV